MGNPARSFDSLTYSNELRKIGVPEDQANLQAKALFCVIDEQMLNKQDLERAELKLSSDIKEVKTDVERVEAKLSADIEKLDAKLSAEIKDVRRDVKESELRLFVRLIGAMVLVGGILKYLPAVHF